MSDPDDPIEAVQNSQYDVGYCRPPKNSQFQPGKSGNPRGRPKGARGLRAELKAELNEFVTISENGTSRRIRKLRVIIKALAAKAAKGNVAAADKIVSLVIQAEGFEDQRETKRTLSPADQAVFDAVFGLNDAMTVELRESTPSDPPSSEPPE